MIEQLIGMSLTLIVVGGLGVVLSVAKKI